jgi:hypothetical protein
MEDLQMALDEFALNAGHAGEPEKGHHSCRNAREYNRAFGRIKSSTAASL